MTSEAFAEKGLRHYPGVVPHDDMVGLRERVDAWLDNRPGRRLRPDDWQNLLPPVRRTMARIARDLIGDAARPVRVLLFDKTPEANWSVAWHQDRVIAVQERAEAAGLGPWSTKDGMPHVEPPLASLEHMVTLRLHIDDCGADNAPLKVAQGSHRLGLVPAHRAASEAAALPVAVCEAKAGDIWATSALVLHASERSRADGHRRVLHVDFAAADLPAPLRWLVYAKE